MRFLKIFCILPLFMMLSGCFDYNEMNMQELVNGVAADVTAQGIRVNVVCAATGSEEEKLGTVYEATGKSFFDAVREVAKTADKKLYWGHASCILIGEEACGDLDSFFDAILRAQDVDLDIAPVIAKGEAADIVSAKTASGADVFESISGAFANERNSKRFRARRLWELLRERSSSGVCILPTVEKDGEIISLSGGAVIGEEGLRGHLSGEQMLLLSLLTESGAGGYLPPTELSGGRQVSFEILANEIRRKEEGDTVRILHSCVLSPAEVKGEVDAGEMERVAKAALESGFSALIEYAEENDFGDIFKTGGKRLVTETEITVSNILGGK